ncbi:pentatricopeptide repeat-containing protein At3g42630 [Punica granatum]|uniref:Uncharacterized protein n=2 Tax=Punica granatum TaxID=22663 RepID=A0A2I0L9M1_PUNGR|nr:pentatricopeptide repeat-containing protein At3g42630 [Punica granatum]PKI76826.1 hypothetical protein CRG98_002812 [Punica granatum]
MAFSANPPHHFHPLHRKVSPCRPIRANNPKNFPSFTHRPISSSSSRDAHGLMKKETSFPSGCPYSSMILGYARNGLLPQAMEVWEQMIYSSYVPSSEVVSELMDALASSGQFNVANRILNQVSRKAPRPLPGLYTAAISCFGKGGQLQLMNATFKKMVSLGVKLDSATGNEVIRCYSSYGTLEDMETAYSVLKQSRHLIQEQGVRSMSMAYIREGKFFRLGEFVRDVGLGRRDLGNLLWNVLLLSFAVNFKMKSLQREFLRMTRSGFVPDIDTFNIRMLAFSRMSLFWDLHLSLQHMEHGGVVPDLVTVGCVVDAYLERKLGRNLGFALKRLSLDDPAEVSTDPLVFEAFGKGDFHLSSEAFMEFDSRKRKNGGWSYRDLVAVYLKKQSRRECIFWNY